MPKVLIKKNAFDAICYTLPRTLRQSQKINNSLWLSHLFGSCCFSSFAHAVTLGAFFVSLSLQITRLLEDSGTVFMSTCWRLGSCQTRLTQRLARPTMTPSRYSVVTYAAKLKYRLFSFMNACRWVRAVTGNVSSYSFLITTESPLTSFSIHLCKGKTLLCFQVN